MNQEEWNKQNMEYKEYRIKSIWNWKDLQQEEYRTGRIKQEKMD